MGHWERKRFAIVRQVALSVTRPFLLSRIYFNTVVTSSAGTAPSRAVVSGCVGVVANSDADGDFG